MIYDQKLWKQACIYIYIYIYIYNKKIYFIYYNIQTIFNPLAKLEILYYNFVLFYS